MSGLVIVLTDEPGAAAAVLEKLRSDDRLTAGPATGSRIPVVLDTPSADTSRDRIERLRSLPGVAAVEIAYVDFSDTHAAAGRTVDGR